MNRNLIIGNYGPLHYMTGLPEDFSKFRIPGTSCIHAAGAWGVVCLQELRTSNYLLRHFIFSLTSTFSFTNREENEGLQSLLNIRGDVEYQVNSLKEITLTEKEYTLLNAADAHSVIVVSGEKLCSLFNVYYQPSAYTDLLPLFPAFQKDLKRAAKKPYHFLFPSKVARYTVHDAIKAIWYDRYMHQLEKTHIELRMKTKLFSLLSQAYNETPFEPTTPTEREKATAAREILLENIRVFVPLETIAAELNCSISFLKRAFSKQYGIGPYNYLRRTRMETAKEMLVSGKSLKAAALEVGMDPSNFPKEFKSYFGYNVTQLKKGLR